MDIIVSGTLSNLLNVLLIIIGRNIGKIQELQDFFGEMMASNQTTNHFISTPATTSSTRLIQVL
jgi:hypothetical protein